MESFLSFDSTENFRKKLILRNLKPYNVFEGFSSEANIKEISIVDYAVSDSPSVDEIAKKQEPNIIGLNKYSPGKSFGDTILINKNFGTESNFGKYPFQNLKNTKLEKIGVQQEFSLYTKNIYGPINFGQTYGGTVDINKNSQTDTNKGEYSTYSAIGSLLETEGDKNEIRQRVLNKYSPNNQSPGYGEPYSFPIEVLGSNSGEYSYVSNGPNETSEQVQIRLYNKNKYGPIGGYNDEVEPNILKPIPTNQGELFYEPNIDNVVTEAFIRNLRVENYLSNKYGPEGLPSGYGVVNVKPNLIKPVIPNQGELFYYPNIDNVVTDEFLKSLRQDAYLKNTYNTGTGDYDLNLTDERLEEIFQKTEARFKNDPYLIDKSTLIFIKSDYTALNIYKNNNPTGSQGTVNQDSDIALIGAKELKKELQNRLAAIITAQSSGINSGTNSASASPTLNPFTTLNNLATDNSVLSKNYRITVLPNFQTQVNQQLFELSLTPGYKPSSVIPGQYFDFPARNFLTQALSNPVAAAAGQIANLATTVLLPFIDTSSELFLKYTTDNVKQLLFDQLFYNQYRPKYRLDSVSSPNLLAPKENYYIGETKNFIRDAISPRTEIAKGKFGKLNIGPVFSYGELGKEYEGKKVSELLFGLNTKPYYDSFGLQGGFTWVANNNYIEPGAFVGPEGQKFPDSPIGASQEIIKTELNKTNSSKQEFTDGSLLDITQKLIEAGNRSTRKLEHVGNAINQISKVFNDGYNELTKGSKVIRYETPTSKGSNTSEVKGYEYCRLFTKDNPYYSYSSLQKNDGNLRGNVTDTSYSILDNTFNLNIAPMKSSGQLLSSNITKNGVKKYMFSIENLAWRTSNRQGYRVEDLPGCEIGPNGGRIMWFPPYDLSFDDSIKSGWESHSFLGRIEPIYTFKGGAERTGSISFKIVVDHPSVLNTIVSKELEKTKTDEATKIVDSFFAGCLKYDLYDLLKKYPVFSPNDISQVQNALQNASVEDYKKYFTSSFGELGNVVEKGLGIPNSDITFGQTLNNNVSNFIGQNTLKEVVLYLQGNTNNDYDTNWDKFFDNDDSWSDKIYEYADPNIILSSNTETADLNRYVDTRKKSFDKVKRFFKEEYRKYKDFRKTVLDALKSGSKVKFDIDTQNGKQTERDTIYEDLINFKKGDNQKKIKDYLPENSTDPLLTVGGSVGGDNGKINNDTFQNIDCTKEISIENDKVYSTQATFCRRVVIRNIEITSSEKKGNESTKDETLKESSSDALNPNNQANQNPNVNTNQNTSQIDSLKKNVTKKLVRTLLSECDYFEMIKKDNPFIYDGIKEKLKYFHPAFHSITPEGLNARLTFLNQCSLPGDTIPTAVQNGGSTTPVYNDVYNSAFGSPPICVLRVGDFYHSKIAIESVTFKYTENLLDLNPEGIGVQPMIAEVTLSIKFIGGHGLKEPITKLNNALSFNFYANTELYDERAVENEVSTTDLNAQDLETIRNDNNPIVEPINTNSNDNGNPIGKVDSTSLDPTTSNLIGNINYSTKMDSFLDESINMIEVTKNTLYDVSDKLYWGGLIYFNADRKYTKGYFNNIQQPNTNESEIFGKQSSYTDKINKLFKDTKEDVDNDNCPLLATLKDDNSVQNGKLKKVKDKLKEIIDKEKTKWLQIFTQNSNQILTVTKKYVNSIDQINFVLTNVDGFKNKDGNNVLYNISATTEVTQPTTETTTYDELKSDFINLGTQAKVFYNELRTNQIITNGIYEYKDDYSFVVGDNNISTAAEKRFFMIFVNYIIDVNKLLPLLNELVVNVNEAATEEKIKSVMANNAGYNFSNGTLTQKTENSALWKIYKNSIDILKNNKTKFETTYTSNYGPNFKPYNKSKTRKFTLSELLSTDPSFTTATENFNNLCSSEDSDDDLFNLKKKFK